MKTQTIILSVAAIAIGAAGFFMGKSSSSDLDAPEAVKSSSFVPITRGESISQSGSKRGYSASGQVFRSTSEVLEQDSLLSQMEGLIRFYKTLDPDELAAEADKLKKLRAGEQYLALNFLLLRWAELDPIGAIAKSELGGMGMHAKFTIVDAWASVDPYSAAEYYMKSKKDGKEESITPYKITAKLAEKDPGGALNWALETGCSIAVDGVFMELGRSDPDKAAQLVLNLDQELRDRAYKIIGKVLDLDGDYSEIEAWISRLPLEVQSGMKNTVLVSLSSKNPEVAVQQLETVTDPREKLKHISNIVNGYASNGNAAAGVKLLVEMGSQEDSRELGRFAYGIVGLKEP